MERQREKFPVDAAESSSPGKSSRVDADGVNTNGVNKGGRNEGGMNAGGMNDDGMKGDRIGGAGINNNGDDVNGEHTGLNSSSNLENVRSKHLIVGRQDNVDGTSSGENDVRVGRKWRRAGLFTTTNNVNIWTRILRNVQQKET